MASTFALSLLAPRWGAASPPRHVVLTVIDDLGFDDFGFANNGQVCM